MLGTVTLCLNFVFINDAEQVEGAIPEMRKQHKNVALAHLETTRMGTWRWAGLSPVEGWPCMRTIKFKGCSLTRGMESVRETGEGTALDSRGKGSAIYCLVSFGRVGCSEPWSPHL